MLTNETSTLLYSMVPAPATTFSLRFGKQSENIVVGVGTRLLFDIQNILGICLAVTNVLKFLNENNLMRPLGCTFNQIMRP